MQRNNTKWLHPTLFTLPAPDQRLRLLPQAGHHHRCIASRHRQLPAAHAAMSSQLKLCCRRLASPLLGMG